MLSVVPFALTTARDVVQYASQCGCAVSRCHCNRLQTITPLREAMDLCGSCGHAAMYHTKRIAALVRAEGGGASTILRQAAATERVLQQKLLTAVSGSVPPNTAVVLIHEVFTGCVALLDELGLARSRAVHNEVLQEEIFSHMRAAMAICDEAERHLTLHTPHN